MNYDMLTDLFNYELISTSWTDLDNAKWIYIVFNGLEALIWFGLAIFVLIRHWAIDQKVWVFIYGFSFIIFGLSDCLEVNSLPVWLLLLKGVTFLLIMAARKIVLSRYAANSYAL
jgi:hypothetical protein